MVAFVRSDRERAGRAAPRIARAGQSLGQRRAGVRARRRAARGARSGRGGRAARPRLEPDPDQDGGRRRRLAPLRAAHRAVGRAAAPRAVGRSCRRRGRRAPRRGDGDASERRSAVATLDGAARAAREGGEPARRRPRRGSISARELAWIAPRDREARAARGRRRSARLAARADRWALQLVAADVADDDDERRRDARARPRREAAASRPPPWRALLLARLGELARTRAARDAARASPGARRWRSMPAAGRRSLALAEQESEAPGCRWRRWRGSKRCPPAVGAAARAPGGGAALRGGRARQREADRAAGGARGRAPARRRSPAPAGRAGARPGRRRGGARSSGGGGGAAARPAVAGASSWRGSTRGRGRARGRWRALHGAGGAAARRSGGADRARQAAPPPGPDRRGAGAGCARALALRPQDPELQTLRRASGRRASTRDARRGRRAGAPLRRGRLRLAAGAPAARGRGRRHGGGAARPARRARAQERPGSRTFAQRVVEVLHRARRRGQQGVRRPLHARQRGGRHPPGAHLPARRARRRARGPGGDRSQRRGSLRALVRPLLRQPRRGGPLRGAARRATWSRSSTWSTTFGSENQMADYFGDLQFVAETIPKRALGLHADRAREPRHPHQHAAPAAARHRQAVSERAGTSASTASPPRDVAKVDAEPAMPGYGRDGALPARQHLRQLARGRRLVLAPGRGAAGRPTTTSARTRARCWSRRR